MVTWWQTQQTAQQPQPKQHLLMITDRSELASAFKSVARLLIL